MNPWELLEKASSRAHFQAESVGICLGHMTNAIIDLQSGETKATAIATLQRGLDLIEKRQAPIRALAQGIEAPSGGETPQSDSTEGESPVGDSRCAQNQSGKEDER